MVSVFICEDNSAKLDLYTQIINNHILINEFEMRVEVATNQSKQLVQFLNQKNVRGGLYFLNIGLPGNDLNGIEVAIQIRRLDPIAKIVFISRHIETMYLALQRKIEPMDFIVKTTKLKEVKARIEENVRTVFRRHLRTLSLFEERFEYRVGLNWQSIALKELVYIESACQSHKIILHSINKQDEFYANITDIAQKYPQLFRCHRSFLINPDNVACYNPESKEVSFINGESCSIASRKIGDFKRVMTIS